MRRRRLRTSGWPSLSERRAERLWLVRLLSLAGRAVCPALCRSGRASWHSFIRTRKAGRVLCVCELPCSAGSMIEDSYPIASSTSTRFGPMPSGWFLVSAFHLYLCTVSRIYTACLPLSTEHGEDMIVHLTGMTTPLVHQWLCAGLLYFVPRHRRPARRIPARYQLGSRGCAVGFMFVYCPAGLSTSSSMHANSQPDHSVYGCRFPRPTLLPGEIEGVDDRCIVWRRKQLESVS
ncbi:hypothetical protein IWX92DRAFT_166433 [Phyllosticta citricarpa]